MNARHSQTTETPRAAIFCTALIDSDPRRYQAWIDYYTAFFAGESVDLFLYNDGPASAALDLKGAKLVTFEQALGRQDVWIFPGWKRSFSAAVGQLGEKYKYLAHIESDLIILDAGRAEFLQHLRSAGYRTGYTRHFHFIETGLQILNSKRSRKFFVQRYDNPAALTKSERFERIIQYALQPKLILNGERIENTELDLSQNYTYLAQMAIYRFFEMYPAGTVPWMRPAVKKTRRQNLREEIMRLCWAIGYAERILRNRL